MAKSKTAPARSKTAASAARFDPEALRNIAGSKVFDRGVVYFDEDVVEIIAIDAQRVQADVSGSEVYRVELSGHGQAIFGGCSCPAFSDYGFCKHMVATALAANAQEGGKQAKHDGRHERIRSYLRGQNIDGLIDMVMRLAREIPGGVDELESAAAEAGALGSVRE